MTDTRTLAPEAQIKLKYNEQIRLSRLLIVISGFLLVTLIVNIVTNEFRISDLESRLKVYEQTRSGK